MQALKYLTFNTITSLKSAMSGPVCLRMLHWFFYLFLLASVQILVAANGTSNMTGSFRPSARKDNTKDL